MALLKHPIIVTLAMCGMAAVSLPGHASTSPRGATVSIDADGTGPTVQPEVFSQFAEQLGHGIYGGIWVGRSSSIPNIDGYRKGVIEALRRIHVPVVRWPGGCFADDYRWRDGVGPASRRPVRYDGHFNVFESNRFGTAEFMKFIDLIGAKAYLSADIGAAPPEEMQDWYGYLTDPAGSALAAERARDGHPAPWKIPYFALGNELWGCGGDMTPDYAADLVRRAARLLEIPPSQSTRLIAAGPSAGDYHWTDVMMRDAGHAVGGLSLHYYTFQGAYGDKGPARHFDERDWAAVLAHTLEIGDIISRDSAIMDRYDPDKRVWLVVDEWGSWNRLAAGHTAYSHYQENSLRDAVVASLNFDIFARHADRVKMTCIAQMVNVLQALIVTAGDKTILTPTYWVYDMYRPWQGATTLPTTLNTPRFTVGSISIPQIAVSAVRDLTGHVDVALTNADPLHDAPVKIDIAGVSPSRVTARILSAPTMDAHNDASRPTAVIPKPFTAFKVSMNGLEVDMPAKSIVTLRIDAPSVTRPTGKIQRRGRDTLTG